MADKALSATSLCVAGNHKGDRLMPLRNHKHRRRRHSDRHWGQSALLHKCATFQYRLSCLRGAGPPRLWLYEHEIQVGFTSCHDHDQFTC